MIKIQQNNLEGTRIRLAGQSLRSDRRNNVFGSGGTAGNSPGRTGEDFTSPVGGTSVDGIPTDPRQSRMSSPTACARVIRRLSSNSIDELINNPNRSPKHISVAPGIMSVTGLFSDGQVQMVMRGLDQKKGVDIMARPSIMTRSGQASSIEHHPRVHLSHGIRTPGTAELTWARAPVAAFPVTPATPTAFEMKEVGITLKFCRSRMPTSATSMSR